MATFPQYKLSYTAKQIDELLAKIENFDPESDIPASALEVIDVSPDVLDASPSYKFNVGGTDITEEFIDFIQSELDIGEANGIASLDENGHVPSTQLPSYVDDVIEGYIKSDNTKFYSDKALSKEVPAESGKIYLDLTTLTTYRWSGTLYAQISESLALGDTATTAYYGDKGKLAYQHSQSAHAPVDAPSNAELTAALSKKADDFSIAFNNGAAGDGNPRMIKFATFNYSNCNSNNGISAKISMLSGHGNGTSYVFLQDVIINIRYDSENSPDTEAAISADNFKYYGAGILLNDADRQFGDIFWVNDHANKIVDFYCLMGQYSSLYMTPWKRLNTSSKGTVTQYIKYTSDMLYSSGTKIWANNSEIALLSDLGSAAYTDSSAYVPASHTNSHAPSDAQKNSDITKDEIEAKLTGNITSHTHSYSTLALGESSTTAYRGDRGKTAYNHSQAAHAPSNAQKNSDITKTEIEAKLTGNITSHTHSYVPTSRTINSKPLSSNISLSASDVGAVATNGSSTMTGKLAMQMSNPHIHMKDTGYSTDWYFQAYQDQLAFGPTFDTAVKTDKSGNMTVPGTVTVENKVKFDYDSTNECLNFVFV